MSSSNVEKQCVNNTMNIKEITEIELDYFKKLEEAIQMHR